MGHPVLYKGTNLFGAELLPPDPRPLPELVPLRVAVTHQVWTELLLTLQYVLHGGSSPGEPGFG